MAIDWRANDSRNGNWTLDWKRRYNWKRQRKAKEIVRFRQFLCKFSFPGNIDRDFARLRRSDSSLSLVQLTLSPSASDRGCHGDGGGRRGGGSSERGNEERYENSSARAARTPPLDE